jgi:hypothetical protein
MTYLPDFQVKSAHTIDEAVAIAEGENCVFLGGGTGLPQIYVAELDHR